jgi:hypothetical protein
MSEVTPTGNQGASNTPADTNQNTGATYSPGDFSSGSGWGKFESYLGKENFAKFKSNLCQQITTQIGQAQKKAQKAAEQLKKSETGGNIYD